MFEITLKSVKMYWRAENTAKNRQKIRDLARAKGYDRIERIKGKEIRVVEYSFVYVECV